jgi:multidrug resistance efflux pump
VLFLRKAIKIESKEKIMARSRFNIKGTKDFLVAAVFCGFLCLWSIRDAWFPTEKVLEKHPQQIAVSMDVSGVVKTVPVEPGDEIAGSMILATLSDHSYKEAVEKAEAAFEQAKEEQAADVEEKLDGLLEARENLQACVLRNTDRTHTTSHGEEALRGTVLEIAAPPATYVEAGDPVLYVKPVDTFYAFNKTLAILTFIGTIAALIFHRIAS